MFSKPGFIYDSICPTITDEEILCNHMIRIANEQPKIHKSFPFFIRISNNSFEKLCISQNIFFYQQLIFYLYNEGLLDEFYKLKNKVNQIVQKCPLITSNNKNNVMIKLENSIFWNIFRAILVSQLSYDYNFRRRIMNPKTEYIYEFNYQKLKDDGILYNHSMKISNKLPKIHKSIPHSIKMPENLFQYIYIYHTFLATYFFISN